MRHRPRGVPTSEDIKRNAERSYKYFESASVLRRLGITRDMYFYVYGFTPEGKPVCWGPLPQEEAEAAGRGLISGEVFELDTRDFKKAKQEIKAELMRRGTSPDTALRRMYSPERL